MARQFSSHQEHYPSRSGGALGGDRKAATALVFQAVVAGVASTVAVQGDDGTVIAIQATALLTDNLIFNATTVFVAALGGGKIYVEEADYTLAATWNVAVDIFVQGAGWNAILNYDAAGNCITVTGDNVKIRDLKIEIVAGAGAAGTRPNCIFATARTNVEITNMWLFGETVSPPDGSNVRQSGIVFGINMTFSKIAFNTIENFERNGIVFAGTLGDENTFIEIEGNNLNTFVGIAIELNFSDDCTVAGNICNVGFVNNIQLTSCDGNTVTGNTSEGSTLGNGIFLFTTVNTTVSGNTCTGNGLSGIQLDASVDNTVTGNTCSENTREGILLDSVSDLNTLTGNTCNENVRHGILIDDSDDNTVVGNSCNENDSGDTASFDGINITDTSSDNLVHSNTCNDNNRFGINIDDALALRNWCKNNQLRGNVGGAFNDTGTDTKTPFITVMAPNQDAYVGATLSNHRGQQCLDDVTTQVPFEIAIPNEFQEIVTAHVIYVTGANGIINRSVATDFGKVCAGEQIDTHSDAIAAGDIAGNTTDEFECDEISAALTGIEAGDRVGLTWTNFGAAAGTMNATVWVLEVRIRYV